MSAPSFSFSSLVGEMPLLSRLFAAALEIAPMWRRLLLLLLLLTLTPPPPSSKPSHGDRGGRLRSLERSDEGPKEEH
jgi:hypothetical protein